MSNQQALLRAQEIAELIERDLASGNYFITRVAESGDSILVNGVPRNALKAGTHTQTSTTYVITQLPNGISVLGPDSAYQESGKILDALIRNIEDDLSLKHFELSMRLRPNVKFQLEYPY